MTAAMKVDIAGFLVGVRVLTEKTRKAGSRIAD
jgi:hypothetical protein